MAKHRSGAFAAIALVGATCLGASHVGAQGQAAALTDVSVRVTVTGTPFAFTRSAYRTGGSGTGNRAHRAEFGGGIALDVDRVRGPIRLGAGFSAWVVGDDEMAPTSPAAVRDGYDLSVRVGVGHERPAAFGALAGYGLMLGGPSWLPESRWSPIGYDIRSRALGAHVGFLGGLSFRFAKAAVVFEGGYQSLIVRLSFPDGRDLLSLARVDGRLVLSGPLLRVGASFSF